MSALDTHIRAGETDLGRSLGFGVGGSAERPLYGPLSFVGELGYTQAGYKNGGAGGAPTDFGMDYRGHFVTLSPAVGATTSTTGLRAIAFAGPRVDFRLFESLIVDGESSTGAIYDLITYGANVGGGIRFPIAGRDLRADARYSYVLANNAVRSRAVEVRLGVRL